MIRSAFCPLLAGWLVVGGFAVAEEKRAPVRGFVDGTTFVDLVDDDALTVEVSLHGALLRAITAFDQELHGLVGGLESIHAVVLELNGDKTRTKATALVSATEKRLLAGGWERLARVRESGARVTVLVLNDEQTIQGLVVMILDTEGDRLVFANVAGVVDLVAIEQLGKRLDLPGLDDLGP